jgi:hypothetical protein
MAGLRSWPCEDFGIVGSSNCSWFSAKWKIGALLASIAQRIFIARHKALVHSYRKIGFATLRTRQI